MSQATLHLSSTHFRRDTSRARTNKRIHPFETKFQVKTSARKRNKTSKTMTKQSRGARHKSTNAHRKRERCNKTRARQCQLDLVLGLCSRRPPGSGPSGVREHAVELWLCLVRLVVTLGLLLGGKFVEVWHHRGECSMRKVTWHWKMCPPPSTGGGGVGGCTSCWSQCCSALRRWRARQSIRLTSHS